MITPLPTFPTVPGPIVGGGSTPLFSTSTAPQTQYTVSGWSQPILMVINTVIVQDGDAVTITRQISTSGFLTPASGRKLNFKFEGERSWRHHHLYCITDPQLNTNDQVIIQNIPYRVLHKWNWGQFGYVKYMLKEDYTSEYNPGSYKSLS
jgi:hypothetical protein